MLRGRNRLPSSKCQAYSSNLVPPVGQRWSWVPSRGLDRSLKSLSPKATLLKNETPFKSQTLILFLVYPALPGREIARSNMLCWMRVSSPTLQVWAQVRKGTWILMVESHPDPALSALPWPFLHLYCSHALLASSFKPFVGGSKGTKFSSSMSRYDVMYSMGLYYVIIGK